MKHILLCIAVCFLSSCVSLKKDIYLQGNIAKSLKEVEQTYEFDKTAYRIKPNDNLYIKIISLDERTSAFLNSESTTGNSNQLANPMSTSLIGYRVHMDGNIEFPFVGKIPVSGLTLDEVRKRIELAVSKYVEESSVKVKLLNDNITIIGEVNSPGRYLLYDEDINLIEAISLAGDMTNFSNKKRVRLIRKEGDIQQMIVINTLDENILFSPYFNMKPGDIIYVEPRRLKSMSQSNIPIGLGLTFINTALLFYTLSTN